MTEYLNTEEVIGNTDDELSKVHRTTQDIPEKYLSPTRIKRRSG